MDRQAWNHGRPPRRPPSVNAWIDGRWLNVREDSNLLVAKLGDEHCAHIITAYRYENRHRDAVRVLNALRDEIRDAAIAAARQPVFGDVSCYADAGNVCIEDAYWYESGCITMTPAEARALAVRIIAEADKAEVKS